MSLTMSVVTLVLAAGESRRYGDIKQLADMDGMPLLRKVLSNIISTGRYQVIVVLGAHADKIHPVVDDLDVTICSNHAWEEGVSSSIKAGLAMIEKDYPDTEGIVIALGDQWKLSKADIHQLINVAGENANKIIATNYAGQPGVPVYFPKNAWNGLKKLKGDEGARQILLGRPEVVLIDLPNAAFDLDERPR